jgi:NAD+ kinase
VSRCRRVAVMTHRRPAQTAHALGELEMAALQAGVELIFDLEEAAKHGVTERDGIVICDTLPKDVDLCIVLGGDGTILTALRRYAQTTVPVFAVNFGEVGFLATIDPDECREGFERAFRGEFEVLSLPAIAVQGLGSDTYAINDVSAHRKVGERVAKLTYGVAGETVASVRCDGLVVASPAGSTGYNLANGGPVMAWGVEGFVVTFIAPHSLTARPLVVAPNDILTVHNQSHVPVEVSVDGRPAGEVAPQDAFTVRFVRDAARLAQNPGSSFYRRLREKFGRLSN